ncbi:MAG: glycosyltransferase [Proteobacteria bacterium]|nr:glycosyltransferase [Pseudomonadota bacterium]
MEPTVSVIVPVHNQVRFLPEAIDSILAQRFSDFELIIVDDGSTDGSWEAAAAVRDGRLRVERLSRRQGQAAARNKGVELVRGRYTAFLDSDDVALPDRLEREVAHLERNPSIDLVGGGLTIVDAERRPIRTVVNPMCNTEMRWAMLFNNPLATSTIMVRTATLRLQTRGFEDRYAGADDFGMWSALMALGRGEIIEPILGHYRQHGQQLSQTQGTAVPAIQVAKDNLAALGLAFDDAAVGTLRIIHGQLASLQLAADSPAEIANNLLWVCNYLKIFNIFRTKIAGAPPALGKIEATLKDHVFHALTSFG